MNLFKFKTRFSFTSCLIGFVFSLIVSPQVVAVVNVAQSPLFLSQSVKPIVMLNISNDHQLYLKAFDDYSDLDGDGIPETSYKHSFDYYGYFDSKKCYKYNSSTNRYEPESAASVAKYCNVSPNTGQWSGNFLNWASMARIDTIRKMLYGGFRSTDTATLTVLERTYIPTDAHSFAKFYSNSNADLTKLTPFTSTEVSNGITLCNTTVAATPGVTLSQNVTSPPLLRVAKGNFILWASHERFQCMWRGSANVSNGVQDTSNGNNASLSGINASSNNPQISAHRLGGRDFIVRVKVCDSNFTNPKSCKGYGSSPTISYKPTGILQDYGDNDKIDFGLMTGSYRKHITGGVLRKNVGTMTDEINVSTDGTFKSPLPTDSIINTLNKFRILGYRHDDGSYFNQSGSDECNFNITNLTDNQRCSNWGNPQSEMYLESLRYLAGKNANPNYAIDDSTRISGLTTATFSDPIGVNDWCAPLNVIQFNASTTSYDADDLSLSTDLGIVSLNAVTDAIGVGELLSGNYFVGENGVDNNQLCTAKAVTSLSSVRGTCPDGPRLQGSYHIAGLAHYAHTNDIRTDRADDQNVTTYGIALTPSLPKAEVPIPGSTQKVTILPACQNTRENTNCTIVDYKIVSQNHSANPATGKLYVNWETAEQGGDFDQDMWGILDYSVTANTVTVTTNAFSASTGAGMAFGYVINGTTQDGFHAHSGIIGYTYNDPTGVKDCNRCQVGNPATSVTYTIGAANGASLEQPLYYAAKWGGFVDSDNNKIPNLVSEWDKEPISAPDGLPDRYFFAINPKEIATSLAAALDNVIKDSGASASVATNSTRLDTNTVVFQAIFNPVDWTGQLFSFLIASDGSIAATASWDAAEELTSQGKANRNIFSYNSLTKSGVAFNYSNLSAAQKLLISFDDVEYVKGERSKEGSGTGALRTRISPTKWLLGDVINSDPAFIGRPDLGYNLIPPTAGLSTEPNGYEDFRNSAIYKSRLPLLAIGGNDGMLHVFNATLGSNGGKEVFAFVPDAALADIPSYTSLSYTSSGQHKYIVDGSPIVGDVYIDADRDSDKEWRTMLVGSTGAGNGRSFFALDVTFMDPADDTYASAETSFANNRVMWEINPSLAPVTTELADDLTITPKRYGFTNHLGRTMGIPSIVRMANGKFAVVMANGYDSASSKAVLYIIDAETGALIRSITTGVGSAGAENGLSTPITIDMNGDRVIDTIYAGDLQGNMWKFDVSDSNPDNWKIAFDSSGVPQPLYVAKDPSNGLQPITGKPQVGAHPMGGVMVYFGTGKYFETGDNRLSLSPKVQTFYGLWDNCISIAGAMSTCSTTSPVTNRGDLQAQTIDAEGVITTGTVTFDIRQTSANAVNFTTKKGWYMDLLTPPQPGTAIGERIVTFPLLRGGRIIFTTLIPIDIKCKPGGTGWLMELDALTGKRLDETPFDLTGDNKIDAADLIQIFDTNNDGIIDASDNVGASGKKSTVGIIKTPGVISAGSVEYKYTSGSEGKLEATTESVDGGGGRQSWLQIR